MPNRHFKRTKRLKSPNWHLSAKLVLNRVSRWAVLQTIPNHSQREPFKGRMLPTCSWPVVVEKGDQANTESQPARNPLRNPKERCLRTPPLFCVSLCLHTLIEGAACKLGISARSGFASTTNLTLLTRLRHESVLGQLSHVLFSHALFLAHLWGQCLCYTSKILTKCAGGTSSAKRDYLHH